ncbi:MULTISPECIES: hydrogenase maturation nickel metallochaperone HypA [unclassified Shewanella]|uniref:hydrogenase maturation nickel metallochaperone HypA/HybF n=1 Tax=unclassified Shewanella TaxID=196818 RepID=UPI000C856FBB|nr:MULTISPECIES: hydrogenase maturation nickel metallochaperone HypA [unclassified Shewanella]MDO6618348.1 hydrogenase maturation nickel metallochaperone HypA [Shewanella sp. 6_MG-2023]MDO6640707.1 hydrogenase maturation nickel metallochaperone HypA [Shewanella sp. 5_MG-2023]MDO6679247.1 hydrogenase maturation nickel metallochaperone HypA [Shewanella sp. 4_MG-2023]MDO6776417.1 hydrogenase maturation nickel metallochaperone HypA [Shewanella sp. 3_MG-2023]PMG28387.1 hydrogenase maturation nickel
MHEYSIVMSLLEQIEQLAAQNQANEIIRVQIKVGVLSGVEPRLLATAFETFKLEGICHNAMLDMNIQALIIHCRQCDTQSELTERNIVCPRCLSTNTQVIDGEQMMLMQLEMNTD